ncbi:MAG TPA: hypothetical protein PKE29_02055 [Phycisphaerales bacterium]|nr:hypothetical protein [Phycisphaerales bacterium]
MSQYGMQMPAGQMQRGASMNVYTGLLFAAVVALLAATIFVFMQGQIIGPEGNALAVHPQASPGGPYDIKLGK